MGPYVVLDLETTGLDPARDSIIQVALRHSDGREWASFVNPGRPVPDFIRQLTGFEAVDFTQYPTFETLAPDIIDFLGGARLVGHNVRFDVSFLRRFGIWADDPLDTLEWSRLAFPTRLHHGLGDWYEETPDRHDARTDTRLTEDLLRRIHDRLAQFSTLLKRDLAHFLGPEWDWWDIPWEGGGDRSPLYHPEPDTFEPMPLASMPIEDRAREWLEAGGVLSDELAEFEVRSGQLAMAEAVETAFQDGRVLMVEAGTGTGKSLAYLAPAIIRSLGRGERVVVATHTVALQEQLWSKDLPQARRDMPVQAALVKGRGRYLCLYKASEVVQDSAVLGESRERRWALATLLTYIECSEVGDAEEFPVRSDMGRGLWREVMADSHACAGAKCPFAGPCFMRRARHNAESSHVVVVNHALLAAHIANGNILPPFSHLVVDEAHHLAEVLERSLGFQLDIHDWRRRYKDAMTPRSGMFARLPSPPEMAGAVQAIQIRYQAVDEALTRMAEGLVGLTPAGEYDRRSVRITGAVLDDMAAAGLLEDANRLQVLFTELADQTELLWQDVESRGAADAAAWLRFRQWQQELVDEAVGMTQWSVLSDERVSWWEVRTGFEGEALATWRWAPVDIAPLVEERLWSEIDSAALTSATLTVRGRFDYTARTLGVPESRRSMLRVASPFDYASQARLIVPTDSPNPSEPDYLSALADAVMTAAAFRQGHMLVLMTSYRAVEGLAWRIREALDAYHIRTLAQNIDGPARRLVAEFRQNPRAVLIGTLTYWEGVDIPGDDLEVVVMGRLPFRAPGDPLEEAKQERMRAQGQSPFYQRSLPEAVLRFQQGFGRLIRTKTDRGVVIVFDPRVHPGRTRYARLFLDSVADVPRILTPRSALIDSLQEFWGSDDAHFNQQ